MTNHDTTTPAPTPCVHCVADDYDPPCPALPGSTLCASCIRFEDHPEQFSVDTDDAFADSHPEQWVRVESDALNDGEEFVALVIARNADGTILAEGAHTGDRLTIPADATTEPWNGPWL